MDISSTYVCMSEKARKFLPEHKWQKGDFLYSRGAFAVFDYSEETLDEIESDKAIPLLRQDQLQEMVLPDPNALDAWGEPIERDDKTDNVFRLFHSFVENIQERKRSQQTAEQLWLRYVMKEKYGKTWNNTDWEQCPLVKDDYQKWPETAGA